MDTIITFGKYKNQSLNKLVEDGYYLRWVMKQSWFCQKYLNIYNIIKNNVNIEISDSADLKNIIDTRKKLKIHKNIKTKFIKDECIIFGNFIDYLLRYIICKRRNIVFFDRSASTFYSKSNEFYESYTRIIDNKDDFPKDIFKCSLLSFLRHNDNFDISTIDEYKYYKKIDLYLIRINKFCDYFDDSSIILNYNLSDNILRAETDLIINDFIIDIKCYRDEKNILNEKNINQLIMYNYLSQKKNLFINKLGIYDFFRGEIIYWECNDKRIIDLTNKLKNTLE